MQFSWLTNLDIQLRHAGDGDLRKAHNLAKKSRDDTNEIEQPFPDSWLATTAPVALGLLTDMTSEFVIYREVEGRDTLWPLIADQYKLWCVGRSQLHGQDSDEGTASQSWFPCETLVRISCREMFRLPQRIFADVEFKRLPNSEQKAWSSLILQLISDVLARSTHIEEASSQNLLALKREECTSHRKRLETDPDDEFMDGSRIETPFGRGNIAQVRNDFHPIHGTKLTVNVVELDFGATLYQPIVGAEHEKHETAPQGLKDIPSEVNGTIRIQSLCEHFFTSPFFLTIKLSSSSRCILGACRADSQDSLRYRPLPSELTNQCA